MNADPRLTDTAALLRSLLALGTLPKTAVAKGQNLLAQLEASVRLSIFGDPGSGKSSLINALVGETVLPDGMTMPPIEFVYHDRASTRATLADGSIHEEEGYDPAHLSQLGAVFAEIALPLARLRNIRLLEVVADSSWQEQQAAINWAAPRTDIGLWCTLGYEPSEQGLWAQVPDNLKDNSFLILTKTDQLVADGVLKTHIANVTEIAGDDFRRVFPVALTSRSAADAQGRTFVQGMDDGVQTLLTEVTRYVERGRQARNDAALMFLSRFGGLPEAIDENAVQANEEAAKKPASSRPVRAVPLRQSEICETAFDYLRRRAEGLTDVLPELGAAPHSSVLGYCVDTIEHLSDLVSDGEDGSDGLSELNDTVAEASDIMLLLQLENEAGPAADAVSLLLQLKRDFETRLAA